MKVFWLVWNEENFSPSIKHDSEKGARDEAERLAWKHPDSVFHILELLYSCRRSEIQWNYPKER